METRPFRSQGQGTHALEYWRRCPVPLAGDGVDIPPGWKSAEAGRRPPIIQKITVRSVRENIVKTISLKYR